MQRVKGGSSSHRVSMGSSRAMNVSCNTSVDHRVLFS